MSQTCAGTRVEGSCVPFGQSMMLLLYFLRTFNEVDSMTCDSFFHVDNAVFMLVELFNK
jgi:hypothetical protein